MQLTNYSDYIIPGAFVIIVGIQLIGIFIVIIKFNNAKMMDFINELNDYKTSNEIYNKAVETRNELLVNTLQDTTDILVSYGKQITEMNIKIDDATNQITHLMIQITQLEENAELDCKTINQLMIQITQLEDNAELENINVNTELDTVKANLLQVTNKCHKMGKQLNGIQMIENCKKECIDGVLQLCKEHKFVDIIEDMSNTLTPNQIAEYKTSLDIDYNLIFECITSTTSGRLHTILQNYQYTYGYPKVIDTTIATFDNFIARVAKPSEEFMTKVKTIEGEMRILTLVILIGNEDITTINQHDFYNKYDTITKVNSKCPILYQLFTAFDNGLPQFPFLQKQNITKPANLMILSQLCQCYSNFLKNMRYN
jgi:hypothetical protein